MQKALCVMTLVVACANRATSTSVESRTYAPASPIETVMVFTDISDPPFAGAMNLGFEESLRARLAECGVRSEFRAVVRDGGEFAERSEAQMEAMHTNAALFVTEAGGRHTTVTGNTPRQHWNVNVRLRLFDRRVDKLTWEAVVNYVGDVDQPSMGDGRAFAATVVTKLRGDGMMVACTK